MPEPTAPEPPTAEPPVPETDALTDLAALHATADEWLHEVEAAGQSPKRVTITASSNNPLAEIESPRTAPRNRRRGGGRRGPRYPADVEAIRTLFRE